MKELCFFFLFCRVCSGMIWFWGNYTEKKTIELQTHILTPHFSRSLPFGEFHLNSLFHTKRLQLITLAYCIFFWCVHFLCVRHQHKQPAHLKPSPSFHLNWQFTLHSLYNLNNVIVSLNVKEPRWCVSLQPQQLQLKIIYIVSTINFGGQSWGDRLVLKYSSVSLPPGQSISWWGNGDFTPLVPQNFDISLASCAVHQIKKLTLPLTFVSESRDILSF